jgi:hypothetical protein
VTSATRTDTTEDTDLIAAGEIAVALVAGRILGSVRIQQLDGRRGEFGMLVLSQRNWSHPTKEFLHAWYTRIGYKPVHCGSIDEHYPHLASLLATPCDFVVYHKVLTALGSTS